MILITVGTEKYPFNRLMRWIDRLIEEGFLQPDREEVFIQYGSCTILPSGVKAFSLLPENKFKDLVKKARLIIAHCGEGTVDLLVTSGKRFILVPRFHQLGEHVDDHQIELAEGLESTGVPIAKSVEDLVSFLAYPKTTSFVAPRNNYAKASYMLEQKFGKDLREEKLTTLIPNYI